MNPRKYLVPICVACLLLTAGCTAPIDSPSSPELTSSEVTDSNSLIRAHTETLRSQTFTVRSTTTVRDANDTFRTVTNRTWRVDPRSPVRASAVRTRTVTGDVPERSQRAPDRITSWRHGNDTVVRIRSGNDTRVRDVQLLNSSVRLNSALHRQLLYRYSTRRNTTVETVTRNGTSFYRVRADLNDTHVTSNASMTLLVHPSGYVRQIETRQTVAYRSGPRVITQTVRFERVGTTTVEAPAWV